MIDDPVVNDPVVEYERHLRKKGYFRRAQEDLEEQIIGPTKPAAPSSVLQRMGAAVGRGVTEGVASMADTAVELGQGAVNATDKVATWLGAKPGAAKRLAWGDEAEYFSSAKVSEWNEASLTLRGFKDRMFPEGKTWWEGAVSGISQFAAGMVPGAGAGAVAMRGAKAIRGSKFLLGAGKGAVADFAAFDPDEARLADITQNGPAPIRNTLGALLAPTRRDADDSRLEGRFKQAAEGFITGSVVEGVIAAARRVRGGKAGDKATVQAPEAVPPTGELPVAEQAPPKVSVVADAETGGFRVEGPAIPKDIPKVYATEAEAQSVASVAEAMATRAEASRVIDDDTARKIWAEYEAANNGSKDIREVYEDLKITILNYTGTDLAKAMKNIVGAVAKVTDPSKETITLGQVATQGTKAAQDGLDNIVARGQARRADDASRRADGFALKLLTYANADMAKHYADVLSQNPTNELAMREMTKFLNNTVKGWQEFRREGTAQAQNLVSRKAKVDDLDRMLALMDDADLPEGVDVKFELKEQAEREAAKEADRVAKGGKPKEKPEVDPAAPKEKVVQLSRAELIHMARAVSLYKEDPGRILAALIGERRIMNQAEQLARKSPEGMSWGRVGRAVESWRVNAMLSGIPTTVLQTVSSTMQAAMEPAALIIGGLRSGDKSSVRFGVNLASASMDVFLTVLSMGRRNPELWSHITDATKQAWQRGEGVLDSKTSLDVLSYRADEWGPVAAAVNTPTRLLTAVDEFNKQLHYAAFARAQATSDFDDLVKSGLAKADEAEEAIAAAQKMAYNLEGTGQATNPFALDWARRQTFTTPLDGNLKKIQDVIQAVPFFRQILPFFRTPVNIYSEAAQYAPGLGMMSKRLREELASPDPIIRSAAMGKQAIGYGMMATTFSLVSSGMMTGNGPSDPRLRKQWEDAGNKPYTIRLPGGAEIQYRRMEPMATVLGIFADSAELWGELDEAEAAQFDDLLISLVAGVLSSAQSKSFLTTISDLFDAFSESDSKLKATTNFIGNYAGSFVPALVNNANKSFLDDELKASYFDDFRNILDKTKSRIPGFSKDVEARRNIFGEPVLIRPANFLQPMVWPMTTRMAEVDPVMNRLVESGIAISAPPKEFGEAKDNSYVDLTDKDRWRRKDGKVQSPYDRMQELLADRLRLREQVSKIVMSDQWENLPKVKKEQMVKAAILRARNTALKITLTEYVDLAKATKLAKLDPLLELNQ